jgi:hypothetical protein
MGKKDRYRSIVEKAIKMFGDRAKVYMEIYNKEKKYKDALVFKHYSKAFGEVVEYLQTELNNQ